MVTTSTYTTTTTILDPNWKNKIRDERISEILNV
jgi:hypothetical protein